MVGCWTCRTPCASELPPSRRCAAMQPAQATQQTTSHASSITHPTSQGGRQQPRVHLTTAMAHGTIPAGDLSWATLPACSHAHPFRSPRHANTRLCGPYRFSGILAYISPVHEAHAAASGAGGRAGGPSAAAQKTCLPAPVCMNARYATFQPARIKILTP